VRVTESVARTGIVIETQEGSDLGDNVEMISEMIDMMREKR
jgi:hypothetical protein